VNLVPDSGTVRRIYLDYNAIALRLDALAGEIRSGGFGALVIILRGGSFAGLHLSFLTGLPCHFLKYDRLNSAPQWVGETPKQGRLLLCEDFAGMGRTLVNSQNFLVERGYDVCTFTVCRDRLSASVPDYCSFDARDQAVQFLLPWERYRINPAAGAVSLVAAPPDHEYERTAWDLDGVFLYDLEPESYAGDLESTLSERDKAPLAPFVPTPAPQDAIITGRPVMDTDRTLAWLRRNQIDLPVVLREDGDDAPTALRVAAWKGGRAVELGFTHFVESDSIQAIHIAALYPELRVTWWNHGAPIALQAATDKGRRAIQWPSALS
jgi:hypothetical protein